MLSNSSDTQRGDPARRQRLFKRHRPDHALPRPRAPATHWVVPLPRRRHHRALTNAPLTCSTMILENDGAARTMRPCDTYGCADASVSEILTFHDHRFLGQPNAVFDESDCRAQMAVKTVLRGPVARFRAERPRRGALPAVAGEENPKSSPSSPSCHAREG